MSEVLNTADGVQQQVVDDVKASQVSSERTAHTWDITPRTDDVHIDEQITFAGLLLSEPVLQGLKQAGFDRPSPIQIKAIPLGRCGFDLVVQAKSGTGKTCVFAVITLENVDVTCNSSQVLVLAPTREIAVQIQQVICAIGCAVPHLHCQTFIGGFPLADDVAKLKKCHIAVGTPGRIKQLISEKVLKVESIRIFVLDEADKLLESSFQDDVNWIYSTLPASKQMMTLSATYPESLAHHITIYMHSPVFIRLNAKDPSLLGVRQYYRHLPFQPLAQKVFEQKCAALIDLLSSVDFHQCLVFSNYQLRAESLCSRLSACGWPSAFINGSQGQTDRLSAMSKLKRFQCRVLISTDLTSRGIDAENVNLIVNLDVPYDHETYLHRIGRAGRFGTYGVAVTFVCGEKEKADLGRYAELCNMCISPLPASIPVDLAQDTGSSIVPGSGGMMEKVGLSIGSNHLQADAAAITVKSVLSDCESVNNLSNAEAVINLSGIESQQVSQVQTSENSNSVLCQSEFKTDCDKPDLTTTVEKCNIGIAEAAADCKNTCFSMLQGQSAGVENDLMYADSDDIDVRKLGSALWSKTAFVPDVGTDYSFAALTADHENFCKENNLENVAGQKVFLSGCNETDTVPDVHETEWATLSRWLKKSEQEFGKQFPQCAALMYGLPAPEQKLSGNTDTSSEKHVVSSDNRQTPDSKPYYQEVNAEPVCSINSEDTSISSQVYDAGLHVEPVCSDRLPSDALLTREKILSLQFSGVSLSPQVTSRVRELKLKRVDNVLQPANGRRFARNAPPWKRLESNLSSVTEFGSQSTKLPVNSASGTTDALRVQSLNQQTSAVSTVGIDTSALSQNLPDPCVSTVKEAPVDPAESYASTNALAQEAQSGKAQAVLYSTSQPMNVQSDIIPIVSPVSYTLADAAIANVISNKQKSADSFYTKVDTTHKGDPLKSSSADVIPLSSCASSISRPVTTAISRHQKNVQSTAKLQSSPPTVPSAVTMKPHTKKHNILSEFSEPLAGHNYYHKDSVSSPVWPRIPESGKHSVTSRSSRQETHGRFTEERRRKPRLTSRRGKASVNSPDAGVNDCHSWSRSQCAKCSRPHNANSNAAPSSHSSRQNPYDLFDYHSARGSAYMMPSILASVSYSSYCLGAYDAHMRSMHYYNHQATSSMWQQQADYIRRMAKFYAYQ